MNKVDDMKFFVWLNDQQVGPFDEKTIQKMLSEKQVTEDTLVCPESGDLDWLPIREVFIRDLLAESSTLSSNAYETLRQSDDGSRLEIRLNSGAELTIKAVQLYSESAVAKVNSKKAEAIKLLKGVSTGIGAWGSIEWVLEASAVIGAIESVLSAGAPTAGACLLEEAIQAERKLRNEGILFPVGGIQYIENPAPGFWRAAFTRNTQVETQVVKSLTIQVRPKTENRTEKVVTGFVHNGDEFIIVQTDDGSMTSIRWSAVEQYYYSRSPS